MNERNYFTKNINFTAVTCYFVNGNLQPEKSEHVFSRKLNKKQVMAILRKAHGERLLEQTVTINHYTRTYEMSIEYFTEVADQVK